MRQPLRVVVDSRLRTPRDARILEPPGEVLLAHVGEARDGWEVPHLQAGVAGGQVDLALLLERLAERGCNEVLIEAGPTLTGAFMAQGLWDELLLYVAPKLLGSDAQPLATLPLARMSDAVEATMVDQVGIGHDIRIRLRPAG